MSMSACKTAFKPLFLLLTSFKKAENSSVFEIDMVSAPKAAGQTVINSADITSADIIFFMKPTPHIICYFLF